ncbi:MAG: dihydrofolate reductase [Holosporaceae bacterium]|jgi:dihydrofolate reductase|nr:dihydrofolate reductase [Holosporaceae bacterium]
MIKLIALVDDHFGIAKNNEVPWHFPDDLRFFRENTTDNVVVMGRKTFFSIPNAPLPHRINCVLSRSMHKNDWQSKGVQIFSSGEELLTRHRNFWVIGGAEIYNYFLGNHLVDMALITQVQHNYNADKFLNAAFLAEFFKTTLENNERYSIYKYENFSQHRCF